MDIHDSAVLEEWKGVCKGREKESGNVPFRIGLRETCDRKEDVGDLVLCSHPSIGAREANALLQRVCEDPNDLLVPRRTCGPSASNNLLIVFGRKSVLRHEQLRARQSFRSGLCTHTQARTHAVPTFRPPTTQLLPSVLLRMADKSQQGTLHHCSIHRYSPFR